MRLAVVTQTRARVGGAESYLEGVLPPLACKHEVAFWAERTEASDRGSIQLPDHVAVLAGADAGDSLAAWRPDVVFAHGLDNAEVERSVFGIAPVVAVQHTYHGTCITSAKTMHSPEVRACERRFGAPCLALYYPRRCGGLNPLTMTRLYAAQSRRLDSLRTAAGIVTLSAHMRDELLRHGLQPEQVHVVHPFVAAPQGAEPRVRVRPSCTLLFLGRLETLKGVDRLIDAAPLVARRLGRPVRLMICGDGAARGALEAQGAHVRTAFPEVSIEFAGWADARARALCLEEADALVVPSLWPEPFGLVGLEAAAAGVPAVAFATGGIPEWLTDNVTGTLAAAGGAGAQALAGAIVRCVGDPATRQRLAAAAMRGAAAWTLDRHVAALEPILAAASQRRRADDR